MIKRPTVITAIWIGLLLLFCGAVRAEDSRRTQANITYRIPEGVYVNVGTDQGLRQGMTGAAVLEDGGTLAFEVVHTARNTALLRLEGAESLQSGSIELVFAAVAAIDKTNKPAVKPDASAEPFVPLLAPIKRPPDYTPTKNISHGRIGVRQTYQGATDDQLDYAVSRFYTSGSIDRLLGQNGASHGRGVPTIEPVMATAIMLNSKPSNP